MCHLTLPTKHSQSTSAQQEKGITHIRNFPYSKHPNKYMINSPLKEIYTNHLCFLIEIVGYSCLKLAFFSCKDCLGPNSPCGWCNLNKQCSGISAPCRNASHFLQVSSVTCDDLYISPSVQVSAGNDFTAECPLLDTPPSGGYILPVRVAQDLRLTTRNLITSVSHMTSVSHFYGFPLH